MGQGRFPHRGQPDNAGQFASPDAARSEAGQVWQPPSEAEQMAAYRDMERMRDEVRGPATERDKAQEAVAYRERQIAQAHRFAEKFEREGNHTKAQEQRAFAAKAESWLKDAQKELRKQQRKYLPLWKRMFTR